MKWVGHMACMRKEGKLSKVLVGKPKGNRPLRKLRNRWEDGLSIDLRRLAGGMWSRFTWWALVNMVMNLQVLAPYSYLVLSSHKFSTDTFNISVSGR
jgi:hypothetical protein